MKCKEETEGVTSDWLSWQVVNTCFAEQGVHTEKGSSTKKASPTVSTPRDNLGPVNCSPSAPCTNKDKVSALVKRTIEVLPVGQVIIAYSTAPALTTANGTTSRHHAHYRH